MFCAYVLLFHSDQQPGMLSRSESAIVNTTISHQSEPD
jgi:hypothetical protein